MLYLIQLIYLKEGKEDIFDQFEAVAIPRIPIYNGKLLFRLRPTRESYIDLDIEQPYEIHYVSFESQADFEAYMKDEERKKFLHLKEESIKSVTLIKGEKL
ncbi:MULTISPECIES: DUF1330 domain-containing protein [unclassified Imperialibacter]|uniref:DUF1330 domain-containing protein n=1 Tax=unclassified Imperialibacter TaxID=2629706 RepID=UPI0012545514|nr:MULTISPECIES: DUF1330 domain-containing protein [unclassified Imperialibacter]CAD5283489.1 conserved hypothetical protein [Imperialibacter sp. 89]CAD5286053.1 conserved hypothetical protein [Imperialibacter sp. 75]VVT29696.1 conserved hypothetical protein [Imperialibacter sp. EC-SDR9]